MVNLGGSRRLRLWPEKLLFQMSYDGLLVLQQLFGVCIGLLLRDDIGQRQVVLIRRVLLLSQPKEVYQLFVYYFEGLDVLALLAIPLPVEDVSLSVT